MKLFMMPHTVPNKPTKGAVEPIVASTPVPREILRRPRFDALELRGDALLDAVAAHGRQPDFLRGRLHQSRQRVVPSSDCALAWASVPHSRCAGSCAPRGAAAHFEALGHKHRPGDQRGEDQTDHDGLHQTCGVPEHAPRRQVVRQLRAADGGLADGLIGGRRRCCIRRSRWRPRRPAQVRSARPLAPQWPTQPERPARWLRQGRRRFARAPMGRTDWRSAARCRAQRTRQQDEIALREEFFAFQAVRSAARAPSLRQMRHGAGRM